MLRKTMLMVLIIALIGTLSAAMIQVNDEPNSIKILHSTAKEIVLEYRIGQFEAKPTQIQSQVWHHISLPGEGISQEKAFPELPVYNRSIIVDDIAAYQVEAFDLEYTEMKLPVAPSKGVLSRDIDPQKVPYSFDAVYQSKEFYPAQIAELSEPYILRDFRGITVKTTPFAYRADTQTLRIYTAYKLRIYATAQSQKNTLSRSRESLSRDFVSLYENQFLNWGDYRYIPVDDGYGKLLVISHGSFMTTIQPWVNWKRQMGIETELVEFSEIGSSASQLQSYIQNRYDADHSIAYVQLVGDAQQVPSLSFYGGGSDPSFSLVAGSDYYPDIFIGRFSAETIQQLQVQISRSIAYERDASTADSWLSKAIGIASAEGGGMQGDNGESDIQHMNIIRNKLLNYGYSVVDQIYDPGASAGAVSTNVNSGRGFINYVGHGSTTSWSTTGFNTSHAMALTNGDKAPFIVDVACINGNFVYYTCFAEAWMRSPAGGAITIYASSINQSWNSPMRAQDEITDLWVTEAKNTAGGFYYNGSCKMMDIYGNTSTSDGVKMFKTWHIFGDASLMVRTKTPQPMTVNHPSEIIIGTPSMNISTSVPDASISLCYEDEVYAHGFTDTNGNLNLDLSEIPAETLTFTLTVTAFNRVTYLGEVQQVPASGNAVISIDPSSISETVNIGDSISRQITIENTGDADLIWTITDRQLHDRSLNGSILSCNAHTYNAGSTATWSFTVENNSIDYEWIKDIQIDFPSTVTVNSVTSFSGGSHALTPNPESGTGVSINWHYEDSFGYGGIHDGESATATVNVSISSSATGELNLPWILTGDDYGSAPHQISGALGIDNAGGTSDPAAWWSVDISSGIVSPSDSESFTLAMTSADLEAGIYNSTLVLRSNASNCPQYSILLTLIVHALVDSLPSQPRFVAEWEPATAALVSYAGEWGQPYALLRDLASENMLYVLVNSSQEYSAQNSLQANGVNLANVRYLNADVDSYWVRDYGPWTIFNESGEMQIVDFAYNRPRPNDNAIPGFIATDLDLDIYDLGLSHTGGNIMTDGMGKAMSTELLLSENSTLSQMQIAQIMEDYLGITDYQIYTDPTNTYIDHIDCWAKLLDVDKVLIRRVPSTHPQYAAIEASVAQWQNQSSSYGTPYRIYRVDTPNNEPYTNSFIFNRQICVPQMGTAFDAEALAVYQNAMPGYSVSGYSYPSYQSTDALHCRINTIFDSEMIALQHQAPESLTAYQMQQFSVQISHHNAINPDSTYILWRCSESSPWQKSPLIHQGGNTWIANIPAPAYTQNLYYWIQAMDDSERKSTLPLCASADPFVIQVDTPHPNLPEWIPVTYNNPPALVYVDINPGNNLVAPGDLLGAFVGSECRGTAVISASRSMVSIEVQLATAFESVSFSLFSSSEGGVYTTDLNLNPNFGEVIGEDEPLELFITLAKPELSLNLFEGALILSWDAVSNADFYRILSTESPQGPFTVLAETDATFYEIDESQSSSFFRVIAIKQEALRLYQN